MTRSTIHGVKLSNEHMVGSVLSCGFVITSTFSIERLKLAFALGSSPFLGNVLITDGYLKGVGTWPNGNLFTPTVTSIGFDDYPNGVYLLPQTSPYFGKGANVDLVNLATFGVRQPTN